MTKQGSENNVSVRKYISFSVCRSLYFTVPRTTHSDSNSFIASFLYRGNKNTYGLPSSILWGNEFQIFAPKELTHEMKSLNLPLRDDILNLILHLFFTYGCRREHSWLDFYV